PDIQVQRKHTYQVRIEFLGKSYCQIKPFAAALAAIEMNDDGLVAHQTTIRPTREKSTGEFCKQGNGRPLRKVKAVLHRGWRPQPFLQTSLPSAVPATRSWQGLRCSLIKNVTADPGDGLLVFRPTRLDVIGVIVKCAIKRRREPPEINRFGGVACLPPLRALRMRDDIELRPGECADIAFAQPVPPFFIHHFANRIGMAMRCHPVHGDLCHRTHSSEGFAARFVVNVERETCQFPSLGAKCVEQMGQSRECRDKRQQNKCDDPGTLVARMPEKAHVDPPATHQRHTTGTAPGKEFEWHGLGDARWSEGEGKAKVGNAFASFIACYPSLICFPYNASTGATANPWPKSILHLRRCSRTRGFSMCSAIVFAPTPWHMRLISLTLAGSMLMALILMKSGSNASSFDSIASLPSKPATVKLQPKGRSCAIRRSNNSRLAMALSEEMSKPSIPPAR